MKMHNLKWTFALAMSMFMSNALLAQFTVSGKVTDPLDLPLIGVSILVKGTSTGTVSDVDGSFSLEAPGESATLVFSYTGFKTFELDVTGSSGPQNVQMQEDIARLEEVVVTGLASGVKRSNSGNSVASVDAEMLSEQTNPQTLDNALYGKIAGVQMTANGGAPGGGINVQLRGISTLGAGSSQPLYIIDGVYADNSASRNFRSIVNSAGGGSSSNNQDDVASRISDLNPDEIERIEVLKGPSAAAIYGTRANAGVIIITTKRGQAGESKVSFSQDIGYAKGQNFIGFDDWNEQKVRNYFSGARLNTELAALRAAEAEGRITDWEDFFYGETPLLSNTSVSLSGGNQKTQFYASGGFQTEDGIIKNTGYDRYSFRVNLDHKIGNFITVKLNNNFIRTETQRGFTGNQNNTGGSIGYNIAYAPSYANFFPDENGIYPDNPYFGGNPIDIRDNGVNDYNVNRIITAGAVDIDLWSTANTFLKAKINGGVDLVSGESLVYFNEQMQYQKTRANPGDVVWGNSRNLNYNLQGFLVLNSTFGKFNSNTTVGAVRLDQDVNFLATRGQGLAAGQRNLAWANVVTVASQQEQRISDMGVVAQEDLNWDDKIIASVGIRFDKSTLNRDQQKYYAFPKASLAVNLHNFVETGFFDQLKLRGAYGETGGLPQFGFTFEPLNSTIIGGSIGGVVGTQGVDANLVPETAQEIEFGLDMTLLNGRVTLDATVYNKSVKDLILPLRPASSTGISTIQTNAADLENRGVEIGLGFVPVRTANFEWSNRLLWWRNRSEITRLIVPQFNTGGFGFALGTYAIAEGYSPTAIVGNPDNPSGPVRKTLYGDRQPDFQMSYATSIKFLKHFDFSALLHYQKGGAAINLSAYLWDDGGTTPGWDEDPDGDGTFKGQERIVEAFGSGNTGVWIEPTDYLKLRELGLYYTVPSTVLNNTGLLKRLKLGVSANNILLSTKYSSYDPEVSNFGAQPLAGSVEVTPYPSSRRFFFHIKADF
jgi:TonB-dependent starch-binding outer membrane protein SusC